MTSNNVPYFPQRALVSVAHADDIEFGMSGTIARWTEAGAHVTYVIITDNSSGSNEPDADLNALIETRKQEQTASAAAVGVSDVRFLGYQDGVLEPTMALRRELTRIIREVRPDVVMTGDPTMIFTADHGYINHPDHRAAAEATLYAVFPSAETRPVFPELLAEGLEPHKVARVYLTFSMKPNHYEDISSTIERKKEALRCHKSQVGEDAIEMVEQWGAETGKEIGAAYAESFTVITRINEEEAAKEKETDQAKG